MAGGMERDLVEAVLAMWGSRVLAIDVPATGTMNDTVIVSTPDERVVLRGHRRLERHRVAFEHDVVRHACDAGLPVPAAVSTPDGRRIIEHCGRFYSLFQHARGKQASRSELSQAHAAAMGRALGRLHVAFQDFRHPDARLARHHRDVPAVLEGIARLLTHLGGIDRLRPEDQWARARLESRAAWLAEHPNLPVPHEDEPQQLTHGDYQDSLAGPVVLCPLAPVGELFHLIHEPALRRCARRRGRIGRAAEHRRRQDYDGPAFTRDAKRQRRAEDLADVMLLVESGDDVDHRRRLIRPQNDAFSRIRRPVEFVSRNNQRSRSGKPVDT